MIREGSLMKWWPVVTPYILVDKAVFIRLDGSASRSFGADR
jgi:hypothetical protein